LIRLGLLVTLSHVGPPFVRPGLGDPGDGRADAIVCHLGEPLVLRCATYAARDLRLL
jgi:hypothetical protein